MAEYKTAAKPACDVGTINKGKQLIGRRFSKKPKIFSGILA